MSHRDPLPSAEPLSLNPYLYARANPLSCTDPGGLLTEAFGGHFRIRENSADVLQEGDDLAAAGAARGSRHGGVPVYGRIEFSLIGEPR